MHVINNKNGWRVRDAAYWLTCSLPRRSLAASRAGTADWAGSHAPVCPSATDHTPSTYGTQSWTPPRNWGTTSLGGSRRVDALAAASSSRAQSSTWGIIIIIHPIHAAAMFNRMRGLEGKYARHYVNCDNIIVTSRSCHITSLFRHLLHIALFTKMRLGGQALAAWIGCSTVEY